MMETMFYAAMCFLLPACATIIAISIKALTEQLTENRKWLCKWLSNIDVTLGLINNKLNAIDVTLGLINRKLDDLDADLEWLVTATTGERKD